MAEIKWIKLSINMFEDEKIRLIDAMPERDTIHYIWVRLLAQAGKTNDNGCIYLTETIAYTDEMLATIFNRPIASIRMALSVFKNFGMIEIDGNNLIRISNWEKHQNIEGMDKVKEQNRLRKQKQRARQKQLSAPKEEISATSDCHTMSRDSHATEQEQEQDVEQEVELDKEQQHIDMSHLKIVLKDFNKKDFESICDYVVKNNVPVSVVVEKLKIINSMKKVKSKVGALITAIRQDWQPNTSANNNKLKFDNFENRDYDYEDLEQQLLGWKSPGDLPC